MDGFRKEVKNSEPRVLLPWYFLRVGFDRGERKKVKILESGSVRPIFGFCKGFVGFVWWGCG